MIVYIDPRCDIRYGAFYIEGFYQTLGKQNVKFSGKYSKQVSFGESDYVIDRILLCTFVQNDCIVKKVAIDSRDPRSFLENAYQWCDIYAKTNYKSTEDKGNHKEKLLLLPPSFGFRIWNPIETVVRGVWNTYLAYTTKQFGTIAHLKVTFQNYIWLIIRRCYLTQYITPPLLLNDTIDNYAFLIASLWNYKECIQHTNKLRYLFANMMATNDSVRFEGGFLIHDLSAKVPKGWEKLCTKKRVKPSKYIANTKKSFCVFNTPAVRDCHGWKLPEFLAMGKAIISTPLSNDLPVELIANQELLIVKNEKELQEAVESLLYDKTLRQKLEKSARQYWDNIANPKSVVLSILRRANLINLSLEDSTVR